MSVPEFLTYGAVAVTSYYTAVSVRIAHGLRKREKKRSEK